MRVDVFSKINAILRPSSALTLLVCALFVRSCSARSMSETNSSLVKSISLRKLRPIEVHDLSFEGAEVDYAGSRRMGQVMQRGPPRPRPNSSPAMVTTSMPCLRNMVLVATFRS